MVDIFRQEGRVWPTCSTEVDVHGECILPKGVFHREGHGTLWQGVDNGFIIFTPSSIAFMNTSARFVNKKQNMLSSSVRVTLPEAY